MSGTSFTEQSANADKIRTETAVKVADAEANRRRREILDAPKLAAAQAEADRIAREAAAAAEEAERARAAKAEADRAAQEEKDTAARKEAARLRESDKRDKRAAKAVNVGVVAALVVALPLQLRAFWTPERWWEVAIPIFLEGLAWVFIRQAEAAISGRRMVWHYLLGVGLCASFAAGVNVYDGFAHAEIGAAFGIVGGFASIAGPALKVIHEFGARAAGAKATRIERKIAEAAARQAEAELAQRRAELDAEAAEKTRQADEKRTVEAERRAAHEAKAAADKAAADEALAAQDEQRRTFYPEAWKQYERILAAHPLGAISRDRAWDEARRAADHPDVYARYQILTLNGPANVKAADLWAEAWKSVKGLPLGQTIETLAVELAAREYVEQVVAEHLDTAGHLAVEELIADIFGGRGDGGGTPAKASPRKPSGGPAKGAGSQVNIGQDGSSAPRYKHDTEPLAEADLDAARKLYAAAPERFSTPAVTKLLGKSSNYAKRIRDAVQAEQS
ncbi:hypothetical protein [Streptomyces filamentosus]|uniref:hypothetical protein n=1 Tax=Streptomyces filamentosus TaxID=67294 RepID=UPI00123B5BA3|nr:hypothetical protein [Streptomyces filamentosus]KAA6216412.1 hypothetical protein CP979_05230 [Streptomyces filamentosus]